MLGRAEAPGPDAEPGQVLVDLADVHQFPVQHRGQPGFVDDQVAHPEIAVHQSRRRRRRPVSRPASETPTRMWPWCRPCRRAVAATRSAGRRRSGPPRPGRRGGWRPAPVRTAAAAVRGRRRRGARWILLTIVSPSMALQIRYGLPSAAVELSAARMCGTGAPAAAARCCDRGLQLHAGVHVVGRAGAQDQGCRSLPSAV